MRPDEDGRKSQTSGCAFKMRIAPHRRAHERMDHGRVELGSRAAQELEAGVAMITCAAVWAIARHRDVGLGDSQDPRLQWDLRTEESARIAGSIGTLAVSEDPVSDVAEARVGQQSGAELGLAANRRPLLLGERALLVQDPRWDLIATGTAHEGCEAEFRHASIVEFELMCGQLGERPDRAPRGGRVIDSFEFGLLGPALVADQHQSQLARLSDVACLAALQ